MAVKRKSKAASSAAQKAAKVIAKRINKKTVEPGQHSPQYPERWKREKDATVAAKGIGWRWTDEGARHLGKRVSSRPSLTEIENYRNKTFRIKGKPNPMSEDGSYRYLYSEKRADKTDKNRGKKLEDGGGVGDTPTAGAGSYKKGGQTAPQSKSYNEFRDLEQTAKPVGYRYTDKLAKRLGKKVTDKPTAEHIRKYTGKGVYFENRADKSDVSPRGKFRKGGQTAPQSKSYNEFRDLEQTAKPVGYRYTDKLAKRLGVKVTDKPTKAHIEKYLGKGVYFENRADKSDVSPRGKFEKGGISNQYATTHFDGRTANTLWDKWTPMQRRHFLHDHNAEYEKLFGRNEKTIPTSKLINKSWTDLFDVLPDKVQIGLNHIIYNHVQMGQYKKGGQTAPQSKSYNEFRDLEQTAKPVGYRYTDALAKRLGKKVTDKPTAEHIRKYSGKGVYFENRADKSDVSPRGKFKAGGQTAPQSRVYNEFRDMEQRAKPVGYRYTDALAKRLGKNVTDRPTKEHIEKYLGKGVYFENRADKSDMSPKRKYDLGGETKMIGNRPVVFAAKMMDGDNKESGFISISGKKWLFIDADGKIVMTMTKPEFDKKVKVGDIELTKAFSKSEGVDVMEMDRDNAVEYFADKIKEIGVSYNFYHGTSIKAEDADRAAWDGVVTDTMMTEAKFKKQTGYKIGDIGYYDVKTEDGEDFKELFSDNTYNWSYLGKNDYILAAIQHPYDEEETYLVIVPHRGGDARGNYGQAYFEKVDSVEQAREKIWEILNFSLNIRIEFEDDTEIYFSSEQDSDIYRLQVDDDKLDGLALIMKEYVNEKFDGYDLDIFVNDVVSYHSSDKTFYKKGGQTAPQSRSYNEFRDMEHKAKPVGYRFTDKLAKRLGLKSTAKPNANQIQKYTGKGVYFENRADKSDMSVANKFAGGGGVERIANSDARTYTENKLPFKGNNLEGKVLDNGDYVVLSYGYYPIWVWVKRVDTWYGNKDKYSVTTAKHISQSRPTHEAKMVGNDELNRIMAHSMEFGKKMADGGHLDLILGDASNNPQMDITSPTFMGQ